MKNSRWKHGKVIVGGGLNRGPIIPQENSCQSQEGGSGKEKDSNYLQKIGYQEVRIMITVESYLL